MPNFSCSLPVEGTTYDFCFTLIYYPGGVRYLVAVNRQEAYLASFYFEKNDRGNWQLSDRYKTAPAWVYNLEPQLAEAIHSHQVPERI